MLTKNHEFNKIYEEYKNLVLKVAYTFSGDLDMAEDIMQETFLKLYKEMGKKEHTNVKFWLCTTAKYSALNHRKKAAWEISENEIVDEEEAFIEPSRESTEAEYFEELSEKERAALHECIFAHLMEKHQRWYDAITMVCVLEYPQSEAAKRMNMSVEAFYVMLHRARMWIKKTYGVEYEELIHY